MTSLETLFYMIWRGFAIGVIISAPMGPVGMLCIQRTMQNGRRTGFYTGVGAALSDLMYCLLTGFGLSLIEEFLERNQNLIQLIGSLVLIAFGLFLFKKNPPKSRRKPTQINSSDPRKDVLYGFLFTVSNPLIIFLIIGLFARFSFMGPDIKFYHQAAGYLSIMAGALTWWWLVSYTVNKVRSRFNIDSMRIINRIIGIAIWIFASVGIATSIIALSSPDANSQTHRPKQIHYNNVRGYPPTDSKQYNLPCDFCGNDFSFDCRLIFKDNTRIVFKTERDSLVLSFTKQHSSNLLSTAESIKLYATFHSSASDSADTLATTECEGYFTTENNKNFLSINKKGPSWKMEGGYKKIRQIMEFQIHDFIPESITLSSSGAEQTFYDINLAPTYAESPFCYSQHKMKNFTSRALNSKDPLEGLWQMIDYNCDTQYGSPGGLYTVLITKQPGNLAENTCSATTAPTILSDTENWSNEYVIIYISGATTNKEAWRYGMTKGHIIPTKVPGLYTFDWTDSRYVAIPMLNHAVLDEYGILTFQFTSLNSNIRFKQITELPDSKILNSPPSGCTSTSG